MINSDSDTGDLRVVFSFRVQDKHCQFAGNEGLTPQGAGLLLDANDWRQTCNRPLTQGGISVKLPHYFIPESAA